MTFPMQPIFMAEDLVIRFQANRIVRALLERSSLAGFGLNEIAAGDFTPDERMQLAQLIGYSVSGYGDLSYASAQSVAEADEKAEIVGASAESHNEAPL